MNSRRLLFSVFFLFSAFSLSAQTIHWITFFDTEDENVGEMNRNVRQVFYSRFVDVINSDLAMTGCNSEINDFIGDSCTVSNCTKIVKALHCSPSDIIVFYYVGHGFHAANDSTNYPTMVLGENAITEKSIPLSCVHNELKNKGARLVITVCVGSNVDIQPQLSTEIASSSIPDIRQITNKSMNKELELSAIQKAFLCNKGDIILSAASRGQDAFGGPTPLGDMDMLTAVLVTCFEDLTYEEQFSWDGLLNEISSIVKDVTNGKQVPFYNYELNETSLPD